jgi:hypothetical protein
MAVEPVRYQLSGRGTNPETVLDTALDSLANGSGVLSAAIDNDADLDIVADAELNLASLNPTVALCELFVVRTVDGTNYEDAPALAGFVGAWFPTTGSGAKRVILPGIAIPPRDHKFYPINRTGVAFGASGNTLKIFYYRMGVGS